MTQTPPRIYARDLAAAATRLAGTIILDLAGVASGPALYLPRLAAWQTIDGQDIGADDGSIIDLLDGLPARDLIEAHGTPGAAAAALNARLRAEWAATA